MMAALEASAVFSGLRNSPDKFDRMASCRIPVPGEIASSYCGPVNPGYHKVGLYDHWDASDRSYWEIVKAYTVGLSPIL